MTKKDYERAAESVQEYDDPATREIIANEYAHFFADDNPRFDRARFMRACEPGANVRARGKVTA